MGLGEFLYCFYSKIVILDNIYGNSKTWKQVTNEFDKYMNYINMDNQVNSNLIILKRSEPEVTNYSNKCIYKLKLKDLLLEDIEKYRQAFIWLLLNKYVN